MDEKRNYRSDDSFPGMIQKAAGLAVGEVTEAELKAINKYTLEPLKAEEVFTFKAVLCDNELDRHFEHFTLKALQDLQKRFLPPCSEPPCRKSKVSLLSSHRK